MALASFCFSRFSSPAMSASPRTSSPEFKILPLIMPRPDGHSIDIAQIRHLCERGLDTCPADDRAIAWLALTGVMPDQPEEWGASKSTRTQEYSDFVALFGMTDWESKLFPNTSDMTEFGVSNQKLMEIVHGDVVRTGHHILFFPEPDTDPAAASDDPENFLNPFHVHLRRLERILYIFASVNPTLAYMQGFNELVAIIYYTFSQAKPFFDDDWLETEAFVFFTFQQLLGTTNISDLFTTQDRSSLIHRQLGLFMDILKKHLPQAWEIITGHDIHPLYFCYRWLNLLYAQEYMIPDLVLIWDALFAHFDQLVEYVKYVAVAQVKILEPLLDAEDYIKTLTSLQKHKIDTPREVLHAAHTFWQEDHAPAKKQGLAAFFEGRGRK
jgi:hypothetical protein